MSIYCIIKKTDLSVLLQLLMDYDISMKIASHIYHDAGQIDDPKYAATIHIDDHINRSTFFVTFFHLNWKSAIS